MLEFNHGPFSISPGAAATINGSAKRRWTLRYGASELAERLVPVTASAGQVLEIFGDDTASFIQDLRKKNSPETVYLIDFETDEPVASIKTLGIPDMGPGLIDDRSRYWLRSGNRLRSRAVTLSEFAVVAAKHAAPENSWMTGGLPGDTLSRDPDEWRAPTSWELRHIVGEGSFTRISGARAAAMVGVSAQNFRKYTASDDAKGRQSISFAMWHFLLHELGIQL